MLGVCVSAQDLCLSYFKIKPSVLHSQSLVTEIGRNTPLKHLEEKGEDQERKQEMV